MKHASILPAAVGLLLLTSCAWPQDAVKIEAAADEATQQAKKKLGEKIESLDFNQVEARDVVKHFRETYGFNVYVNWKALKTVGVDKSTPVTVKLKGITVARALRVVLNEMGGRTGQLEYIVDEGVLVISTSDALRSRSVTRIYPAADLLCRTRRAYTESAGIPWRKTSFLPTRPEEDEGEAGGGGLFGDAPGPTVEEASAALIVLIKETVSPDSWRPTGETGALRVQGTNLLITQNHKNHEAIEKFLGMLRAARQEQAIDVGLAVVRTDNPDAAKALRKIAKAGGDVASALIDGEDKGQWTLDRCKTEQGVLGDVIRATHAYGRRVRSAPQKNVILDHRTLTGYEVGVLAKSREDGKVSMSVACGSGWLGSDDDPGKDTPEANTGVRSRHNTFDFALGAGQAKLLPVIPLTGKDGGLKVIVWLPKK